MILYKIAWTLSFALILMSCQKFADPALVFEEEPELVVQKARKVLVISVDGLSGIELRKQVPQNIQRLMEHAKYTYEGIADMNTGDASTWTTLLSGKSSANHGIHGNSFEEELDEDDPHGHNSSGTSTGYITFFLRLLEQGKNLKSFSATSVPDLDENVMSYADARILGENDEEVKAEAIDTLRKTNISFGVINFRSVNDAGVSGGFSLDNPAYKAAIDKVDGYIGEIRDALESRANFENEDWMIVVTSNHGGLGNEYGGGSFEERKVPIILYNPQFVGQEFEVPDLVNSLLINTANGGTPAVSAANSSEYQVKNTGEYTILFKVLNRGLAGGNTLILGKSNHAYSSVKGWHFMYEGASKSYRVVLNDGTGGNSPAMVYGPSSKVAVVGTWQTVVAKIYNEAGKRYLKVFVDGVPGNAGEITRNPENNDVGLIIGSGSTSSIGVFNGMINNLAFYDTALSDEEIMGFNCIGNIDPSSPSYIHLKGFWPLDEAGHKVFRNRVNTSWGADFQFTNQIYNWNLNAIWNCLTDKELEEYNEKKQIINQYDILPQIAYWMEITPHDSWALEGKLFLDMYETEFLK